MIQQMVRQMQWQGETTTAVKAGIGDAAAGGRGLLMERDGWSRWPDEGMNRRCSSDGT